MYGDFVISNDFLKKSFEVYAFHIPSKSCVIEYKNEIFNVQFLYLSAIFLCFSLQTFLKFCNNNSSLQVIVYRKLLIRFFIEELEELF